MNYSSREKPDIIVSESDYKQIIALASAAESRAPEVAEELLSEMDRANVLPDDEVPSEVVRMGSTVEYRSGADKPRQVTLVLPVEADISKGRVSILTPVGAALIGLSRGQTMSWSARDGRKLDLTIMSVVPFVVHADAVGS